jgi:hypothetical protein
VDIRPLIVFNKKLQYPEIYFAVGDALRTPQRLKLRNYGGLGHDVVYADILSGAHGNIESLALIVALANALEPRCVTIKSVCIFSELWAKRGVAAIGPTP